jgi:hypothetical protein
MATLADGTRVPLEHPPLRPTGAAGAAMLIAYLAVTGWLVLVALHETKAYHWVTEPHFWSKATASYAEELDARTRQLVIVLLALHLVAMVATAVWARRVAINTRALGRFDVSVGASTWAWLMPFAWFAVGFNQLRKLPRISGAVIGWQVAFVTPFVASYLVKHFSRARASFDVSMKGSVSADTVNSAIRSTWIVSLMFAGGAALALLAATRAVVLARSHFREADALQAPSA